MKMIRHCIFVLLFYCSFCSPANTNVSGKFQPEKKTFKLDMFLSAFSVESDGFPSIHASINFETDTSRCEVSYYDPQFKAKTYSLTKLEIDTIRSIIDNFDLSKLKPRYDVQQTDQPTSTTRFYTSKDTIEIVDRGLEGDHPLPTLYRIVYKLNLNFR